MTLDSCLRHLFEQFFFQEALQLIDRNHLFVAITSTLVLYDTVHKSARRNDNSVGDANKFGVGKLDASTDFFVPVI